VRGPGQDEGPHVARGRAPWSFRSVLVFSWILILVIQQAERLFLIATTMRREPITLPTLAVTLLTGLRADLIAATFATVAAVVLGLLIAPLPALVKWWRGARAGAWSPWRQGLTVAATLVVLFVLAVTMADMGYYHHSQQRLDLVFLEYLNDVFAQASQADVATSQVGSQTAAELQEGGKWARYVAAFLIAMVASCAAWWLLFARVVATAIHRWETRAPKTTSLAVALSLAVGATGLHSDAGEAIHSVSIGSATYYTLAQNPFWYLNASLGRALESRFAGVGSELLAIMPEEAAVKITRDTVAPGGTFPSARYPVVHRTTGEPGVRLARPANVLLLFVEGLDRRFLQRTVGGVRVTPFLDHLKGESVYFEHFFTNGANTFHGLFASFCSQLPRYGFAAIRTHYTHDFLCLPMALRRGGYRSEMVMGQNRDRAHSHLGLFMARNGLDALLDDGHFPPETPRLRLGIVDGAILDLVRSRVESLSRSPRPWLVTTLTAGTHHPFQVPEDHPEVRALRAEKDRYLAPLRYVDLELERLFTALRRDGRLRNTVVLVMGDHGRHEKIGATDVEKTIGHFMSPLMIWLDEPLRSPAIYRPRTVSGVVSQVDLAPTILSLNGLMPAVSPFFGRDVSCAMVRECLDDNRAYVSSVYDDLIGLVERDGIWAYSFRRRTGELVDLDAARPPRTFAPTDRAVAARHQRLMGLYVASNLLLERNRIWSPKEFAGGR
jgi:Sulfatase